MESGWSISGLGTLESANSDKNPLAFLSMNAEQIEQIPFRRLGIQNSQVEVEAGFGTVLAPLNIIWDKANSPNIIYEGDKIVFSQEALEVTANTPHLSASFSDGRWHGDWALQSITTNTAFPPISAQGMMVASDTHVAATGTFASENSVYKGDVSLNYTPRKILRPI